MTATCLASLGEVVPSVDGGSLVVQIPGASWTDRTCVLGLLVVAKRSAHDTDPAYVTLAESRIADEHAA